MSLTPTSLREAVRRRERGIRFDMRPEVRAPIVESDYTPSPRLEGRCLYPFLYAQVSFSGKADFYQFTRVEVGDLTKQTLEEVWTDEPDVATRTKLVEHGISPVCRRCSTVELTPALTGASPGVSPHAAKRRLAGWRLEVD